MAILKACVLKIALTKYSNNLYDNIYVVSFSIILYKSMIKINKTIVRARLGILLKVPKAMNHNNNNALVLCLLFSYFILMHSRSG